MRFVSIFFMMFFMPVAAFCNISLYPFYLSIDADSAHRNAQMRFTNNSNEEKSYDIKLVNFIQQNDGSYKSASDNEGLFADRYLDFSPRKATLKPGESQVVRVRRKGMALAGNGEYVSHLSVSEKEDKTKKISSKNTDGISVNIKPLYGITIPIMVAKGDLSASAAVKSHKTIRGEKPVQEVVVARQGTRSFYGTLQISDKDGQIGTLSKFRIFANNPQRVLKVPLARAPVGLVSVVLMDENSDENSKGI